MGKKQSPQLPAPPTYQQNSNLNPNISFGSDYTKQLLSGDLTGNLSWLQPLVNPNNSANSLSYAQGLLQPQFRDNLQQISNSAAVNGQLESSTFTDALARSQSDLNSQYQSIVSQQAINDSNQGNTNRLNLLNQGLGGLQNFTQDAQNQTNSENAFNLENYQNLVAQAINNQKQANGGLTGALTGALGGAAAGAQFGLPGIIGGGILGGVSGGLTPQSQNLGGTLLSSGASLYGSSLQANALNGLARSGFSAPAANIYASNDLFSSGNSGVSDLLKNFKFTN